MVCSLCSNHLVNFSTVFVCVCADEGPLLRATPLKERASDNTDNRSNISPVIVL